MLNLRAKEVRRFWRAALQHLRVARRLVALSESVVASEEAYHAVYIGGYAVECGLKALYLSQVRPNRHASVIKERFVEIGHNLEGLYQSLNIQFETTMPVEVRDLLRKPISRWVVGLRYEPGHRRQREAIEFLDAVENLLDWIGKL